MLESWQIAWRNGIVPNLSTAALGALAAGLACDDPALMQGATTNPPPLESLKDCPVAAACAVCYGPWKGDGLATVGEVEEVFAGVCHMADEALGEPSAVRYFLNWFDDTPREEALLLLLAEVGIALAGRRPVKPVTPAA